MLRKNILNAILINEYRTNASIIQSIRNLNFEFKSLRK